MFHTKLKKTFYTRPALVVAPKLLGKILVHKNPAFTYAGIIVEVEAYCGADDAASHAYRGMRIRNKPMFAAGGIAYVYFTYGAHHCMNIVTGKEGSGEAVLIRALEPIAGIDEIRANRTHGQKKVPVQTDLLNGPGKICQGLRLDAKMNFVSLTGDTLFVTEGKRVPAANIGVSRRIGISKSVELPYRFFISGSNYISRPESK